MNESKFNFGTVLAIIVLLGYSYFVFMGLDYWLNGNVALAATLTGAMIVVVMVCILIMCRAKASRWKKLGATGQILFGIIVLAVLGASSIPFAHFIGIMGKQSEIKTEFNKAKEFAEKVDQAYDNYVDSIVDAYELELKRAVAGHSTGSASTKYSQMGLDDMAGEDSIKVKSMKNSYRNDIAVNENDSITRSERQRVINESAEMSVWNIAMPENVGYMSKIVRNSVDEYIAKSSLEVKRKGFEGYKEFSYPQYEGQVKELGDNLTKLSKPDALSLIIAIVAALLCFACMMFPYFLTRTSLAARESNTGTMAI
ncbi:MAG: hypothetical protein J6X70_07510 [Muribaculaceae bacterium]|nr:hypothetical protein [Muribaculaceae bacterium]